MGISRLIREMRGRAYLLGASWKWPGVFQHLVIHHHVVPVNEEDVVMSEDKDGDFCFLQSVL